MREFPCPYCAVIVDGINPGDLLNNFRIHLQDECAGIDPDDAAHL